METVLIPGDFMKRLMVPDRKKNYSGIIRYRGFDAIKHSPALKVIFQQWSFFK